MSRPAITADCRETSRHPLAIEQLLSDDERRDSDPILDSLPAVRSKTDADRLLAILDEIERGNSQ